jgi:hypothetical protein
VAEAFDYFNEKIGKAVKAFEQFEKNVQSSRSIHIFQTQMRKAAEAFEEFRHKCAKQVKHSTISTKNAQSS